MLDVGPLTIDYICNSKGVHAYRFEARTLRQASIKELAAIAEAIQKEIAYELPRVEANAKQREYMRKHNDEYNARRRERRGFTHKPAIE